MPGVNLGNRALWYTKKRQHPRPLLGARVLLLRSRQDSNLDYRLRKPAFYPLNYESVCPSVPKKRKKL